MASMSVVSCERSFSRWAASWAVVDAAVEQQAGTIAIGDVRDVADGVNHGKKHNQQASQWNHGHLRQLITYKAEAEGVTVERIVSSIETLGRKPSRVRAWVSSTMQTYRM